MSDQKDPTLTEHEENRIKEGDAVFNAEGEDAVVDKRAERHFLLKADLRILTTISLIYLLSSLVCPNLANISLRLTRYRIAATLAMQP